MDVLKKLVSGRLNTKVNRPHPDAEIIAAFADNSLPLHDRNGLLDHVTACPDCRDILYLALADAAETQSILAIKPRPRLAVRWATLAASIVILGSVVITNRQMFVGHSQRATTPLTHPDLGVVAQGASGAEPSAQVGAKQPSAKVRPALKHMTAKPQADLQFDKGDQIHFAARQSPNSATASVDQVAASAYGKAASANIAAAWSVSPNGMVQRSFDAGKTWEAVVVTDGAFFKAVCSTANDVWAGGGTGKLYHSSDSGQTWTKVEPTYQGKKLTANIVDIKFSDPQDGFVSAENGEIWSTSDSGQSWRLQ